MATAHELRQQRHAISLRMHTLLDSTAPDAQSQWRALNNEQEGLKQKIDSQERQLALETELNSVRPISRPMLGNEGESSATTRGVIGTEGYATEFRGYLKTGQPEKRAALSVSADGVLIPQGFQQTLEVVMKAYSRMRNYCTVLTTESGNTLPYPIMDDTANAGSWLSEAASMNQTSPSFTNVTLGANLLSSDLVLVSVQALQDFAFQPEVFLSEAFGVRLGRATNKAYTIGDGSTIPITGLLTALIAAGGRSVRLVGSNANSGNVGDTNLNSIGSDDFDNLIMALDPAYRDGAMFQAAQSTWDTIRKVKDKYGRPIWQTSLSVGVPDKIMGYPYDYNQDLPAIGAGNNPIIFGNFKKYLVRDVLGYTAVRFSELFMQNHQVGFAAYLRTDGKLLQPKAFVYGNTSAS